MNYYYNEKEKSFARTKNFKYDTIPNGYVEITKEEYERLQEEIKKENDTD